MYNGIEIASLPASHDDTKRDVPTLACCHTGMMIDTAAPYDCIPRMHASGSEGGTVVVRQTSCELTGLTSMRCGTDGSTEVYLFPFDLGAIRYLSGGVRRIRV
jgi:hypothetical protein